MSLDYKVFDSMLDAVIVIDHDFGVHYANTAASILCDVSVKRFRGGKTITGFLEFSDGVAGAGALPTDESTSYRELGFTTASGKRGWAQVSVQPDLSVTGTNDARWILFIRDVSLEKALHDKYKGELDQKESVIADLLKARVELENYSKNLESMVAERTLQLNEKTVTLAAILDSLDQGILVFDANGTCLPFSSRVCRTVLETKEGEPIAGAPIAHVLGIPATERGGFDEWVQATFADALPFEDIVGLGPSCFKHSQGRDIQLTYNQMRGLDQTLKGVVVVATDKTSEVEAKKEASRERAAARRILRILKHRTQFRSFAVDAIKMLARLQAITAGDNAGQEQAARDLHTIKGAAASFAMTEIAELAHEAEQSLIEGRGDLRSRLQALQVSFMKFLDENSDLYGGLRNGSARAVEIPTPTLFQWFNAMSAKPSGAASLESFTETYLKIPVAESFAAYDDVVKEIGERLQKQVAPLIFEGGNLRVIPEPYTELWSAYAHVFRNAVDHGIETPAVREQAGKKPEATITVSFERKPTDVGRKALRITVRDDGAGANMERIRAKLSEHPQLQTYLDGDDQTLLQVIFEPSFSTGQGVTDLSGRGVGLAALKFAAEELGGSVVAFSTPGRGLMIQVDVPEIEAGQAFASIPFAQTA